MLIKSKRHSIESIDIIRSLGTKPTYQEIMYLKPIIDKGYDIDSARSIRFNMVYWKMSLQDAINCHDEAIKCFD